MSNNDQISDSDYRWSDEQSQIPQKKIQTSQNLGKIEQKTDQNINNKTNDSGQKLGKLEDQNIDNKINDNKKSEKFKHKQFDKLKMSEKSKNLDLEEQAITKSDIKSIIRILQQIASGVVELQGMLPYVYNEKGRDTTRRGRAHIYRFLNYYDIKNKIKKAGPIDPEDFDSPIYNIERIYEVLERYSDIINVANDGTEILFVTISHEGRTTFSKESIILPGEVKQFYNVYELRLRSPQTGLEYRVSEYLLMSVSQTSLTPTEMAILQDEHLPDAGDNWLSEDLVPQISPTTFRIQVAVSIAGILSAVITNSGNTQVVDFNVTSGPELIEDGVYVFELLVHRGDNINFRYSEDGGTIKILRIQEIDAATT